VHYDAKAGTRSLDVMRWGLVPYWAKDLKVGFANINANAEGYCPLGRTMLWASPIVVQPLGGATDVQTLLNGS
jgi:hypothetical protein